MWSLQRRAASPAACARQHDVTRARAPRRIVLGHEARARCCRLIAVAPASSHRPDAAPFAATAMPFPRRVGRAPQEARRRQRARRLRRRRPRRLRSLFAAVAASSPKKKPDALPDEGARARPTTSTPTTCSSGRTCSRACRARTTSTPPATPSSTAPLLRRWRGAQPLRAREPGCCAELQESARALRAQLRLGRLPAPPARGVHAATSSMRSSSARHARFCNERRNVDFDAATKLARALAHLRLVQRRLRRRRRPR